MSMIIKAKIAVSEVKITTYGEQIVAAPVYSNDANDPNKSFSDATPSGKIELHISNKAAHGFFRPNREYLVTFEDVTRELVTFEDVTKASEAAK